MQPLRIWHSRMEPKSKMAAGHLSEEFRQARKKAMRLLEHMDRTERGLTEKLLQAGFSEEAVSDALSWVKELGYVNDARYAENYIAARIHEKSRQRIVQDLYRKGIGSADASAAWEEVCELEQPDERDMIRSAVLKKYIPGSKLDEKEMRRLYGYLARRGFRPGDITAVTEELEIAVKFR